MRTDLYMKLHTELGRLCLNMHISYSDIHIMFASASTIFCFKFFAMFPNFGNVSFCCPKDLNRVRGKMVTLNNEVSLRIEIRISSSQIIIILSSK